MGIVCIENILFCVFITTTLFSSTYLFVKSCYYYEMLKNIEKNIIRIKRVVIIMAIHMHTYKGKIKF